MDPHTITRFARVRERLRERAGRGAKERKKERSSLICRGVAALARAPGEATAPLHLRCTATTAAPRKRRRDPHDGSPPLHHSMIGLAHGVSMSYKL
jgi:hypothetical protein